MLLFCIFYASNNAKKCLGRSDVDRMLEMYLKEPQSKQAPWSCTDRPQVGYRLTFIKYFKCESKKWIGGNLIIVACKQIKCHLCGVAFVFMVNFHMQFIGDVY